MNCITVVINHNYFGDEEIELFGVTYRMEHNAKDLFRVIKSYKGIIFAHYPAVDYIGNECYVRLFPLLPHVERSITEIKEHRDLMLKLSLEGKLDNQPYTRGMEIASHYGY